jgi:regulatory protein
MESTPLRLTAIEPVAGRRARLRLQIDGETAFAVHADVLLASGLAVGDVLDPGALAALQREDAFFGARNAALNLLSHRQRSEAELRRRLTLKGFAGDVVNRVVANLLEARLLDDAEFSAAFARGRIRGRPRAPRIILRELRARGVSVEAAEQGLLGALREDDTSETKLARTAALTWVRRSGKSTAQHAAEKPETRLRARRRLYGYLARRGFSPDAIRIALAAALDSASD